MPAKIPDELWSCRRCGGKRRNKYGSCLDCKKQPIKTQGPCKSCGSIERHPKWGYCIKCNKKTAKKSRDKRRQGLIPDKGPCAKCGVAPKARGYSYCIPCRREYAEAYREKNGVLPCSKCGINPRYKSKCGYDVRCYDCILNDPRRIERTLRKNYGIGLEEYRILERRQGNECAVCGNRARAVTKSVLGMVVDHDHESGAVRGLLCAFCNQAIGLIADDPKIAERMAIYLREHGRS